MTTNPTLFIKCLSVAATALLALLQSIAVASDVEVAPGTVIVEEDFPNGAKLEGHPGIKPVIPMDTDNPTYDMRKTMRLTLPTWPEQARQNRAA